LHGLPFPNYYNLSWGVGIGTGTVAERMTNISDSTWTYQARLPSVSGAWHQFLNQLLGVLKQHSWSGQEIFGIHLAVEEALVNAIRHGNGSDQTKQVHVTCQLAPQHLLVEIADEGAGFDPTGVPDCTDTQNLHRPNGRGIMLMRRYMSRVQYVDGGHRVVMEKHRDSSG
jgi:serine/threonine-protein kinase RsbW